MIICKKAKQMLRALQHYRVYVRTDETRNILRQIFLKKEEEKKTMQMYEGKIPHFIV